MPEFSIQKCSITDIDRLSSLGVETFVQAFNKQNTESNMEQYLSKYFAKRQMYSELSQPHSHFYFGMYDGQIAGYLKLNEGPVQMDLSEERSMEVQRLYILSDYHSKGLGKYLMNQAILKARSSGFTSIWLGVWELNAKAIRFYEQLGFKKFDEHSFMLGDEAQIDHLMRLTF